MKKETHCVVHISFMGLIILPWDCPCPGEAAALVAREAGVGKDTVMVTL